MAENPSVSMRSEHAASPISTERIDAMMRLDIFWAVGFVFGLAAAYLFVFFGILPYVTRPGITWALVVFGFLVVLFNAASIVALINHYREDKEHIYGLDIKHLDANRAAKRLANTNN